MRDDDRTLAVKPKLTITKKATRLESQVAIKMREG
jgi:hypothetical protein